MCSLTISAFPWTCSMIRFRTYSAFVFLDATANMVSNSSVVSDTSVLMGAVNFPKGCATPSEKSVSGLSDDIGAHLPLSGGSLLVDACKVDLTHLGHCWLAHIRGIVVEQISPPVTKEWLTCK